MKTVTILAFAILFILEFGCSGKDKIPGDILSQEKMEIVLEDMMKADQFISDFVINRDTSKKREAESIKLYNQVFAIHKITPDKFFRSFTFYQQHPSLLKPVLDSLSIEAKLKTANFADSLKVNDVQPQ